MEVGHISWLSLLYEHMGKMGQGTPSGCRLVCRRVELQEFMKWFMELEPWKALEPLDQLMEPDGPEFCISKAPL